MDFHQGFILDATRGSIARFVNHSCDPNCYIDKKYVNGVPRMALYAGDNGIMTGEEVTYDYKFEAYNRENDRECHCGSAKCRGTLGAKKVAKEPKDALKPIAGQKRKLGDVVGKAQEMGKEAMEGVKRRKINAVKTVKKALKGVSSSTSASNTSKAKDSAKKPAAKAKKSLPKGWVYPKEPQPFRTINGDDIEDPEAIIRARKRDAKANEKATSSSSKSKTEDANLAKDEDEDENMMDVDDDAAPSTPKREEASQDDSGTPKMTMSTRKSPLKPATTA